MNRPDCATVMVFFCHHGNCSRVAADRFAAHGFSNVYNAEVGIDAWSREIDGTVRRYW
jgi:monothiol glutaredoxin